MQGKVIDQESRLYNYKDGDVIFYYSPIIFSNNTSSGEETIKKIAKEYDEYGLPCFLDLFGSYNLIIQDNKKKKIIFFSDNSNQRCFYFYKDIVSDKFTELVNLISKKYALELNEERVIEYIYYGKNFFDETYVSGVKRTNSAKYYVLYTNGCLVQKDKGIDDLNNKNLAISVNDFSNYIKSNLMRGESHNVAISLTGGFDSRYVLAIANKPNLGIVLYSNVNEKSQDIKISKEISDVMNKPFSLIEFDNPHLSDKEIEKYFIECDGYMSMFINLDFTYQMYQFLKNLQVNLKYSLLLTGDTGVLHKDEDWQIDLPNYRNSKTNYVRFFKYIVKPINNIEVFTEESKSKLKSIENKIKKWLKDNMQSINTKSFDWYQWYLYRESFTPTYYNTKSKVIETYAPMLEYRFVINSYNQKRSQRFKGRYMIDFISKEIPKVSVIPTTHGTSTSNKTIYKIKDLFYMAKEYFINVLKFLGRKILGKILFTSKPSWSMEYDFMRSSKIARDSKAFAIEKGYISSKHSGEMDFSLASRLIEVYLIYKNYINVKNK